MPKLEDSMKEKGINLKINDFKNDLANCISRSNLPPGIVQLGLEWALRQVEDQNIQAINTETQEFVKEDATPETKPKVGE
jgi:hypothetical protein